MTSPIMKAFTKRTLKYNLQSCKETLLPNPNTKKYSTDKVAYKAARFWCKLPTR